MFENNQKQLEQLEKKAKRDQHQAEEANEVTETALSHMTPQRQYTKDQEQNKR
ncbi:hypothetical protein [Bacillus solitudinis]|uniref:hypothetical protein n=1 Tax=Bacillus solitudinis TaxID=2014074 RepID=UPI0012FE51B1|nr:hypothetical protein [Bacillus solitudinis]